MTAQIPGSKSLTNRALLLAAAAPGTSRLWAPLVSDDTLAFRDALTRLGVRVRATPDDEYWEITGTGRPLGDARIWCADAGTAARFLPPYAATGEGEFVFDGSAQLRARPLRPLADALTRLGARVRADGPGSLPLTVSATGLDGGSIALDASTSSQYVTGLLIAAPLLRSPLTLAARDLVSRPYVDMTLALMRRFGATVEESADGSLTVGPGGYRPTDLVIEPDASTATYVFAAAAATGRSVRVPGLGRASLQGDLRFTDALRRLGAHVEVACDATTVTGTGRLRGGISLDMGEISDTFMTLAAIAPLADGPVTIRGVAHARLKESDRVAAMARNLAACGIRVEEGPDRLTVHPGLPRRTTIACHRDHRIAMAFSVLGLAAPDTISLDDPGCVSKTFPGFHAEFGRLFPEYELPLCVRK
ncbi:3-phosphoshikimate 1-carboxyvinyltransferase [Streptomyces sp. LHD-70]|uniref:3-phosphoshikimate 1-carboxyvinyltransferase n=1 Tax=Streptomyces sp. LHD-70 TaxID=3072140 RepID=UPI00280C6164|nr:3-phosphoshikimate 1-carboxyvinyltransferase [Streptomyces sp. LHD-70]MDQ8707224.1 3-phosphoshikimate 1-carboxyvinyltransferase [Streptomyces sp. LHD-70]